MIVELTQESLIEFKPLWELSLYLSDSIKELMEDWAGFLQMVRATESILHGGNECLRCIRPRRIYASAERLLVEAQLARAGAVGQHERGRAGRQGAFGVGIAGRPARVPAKEPHAQGRRRGTVCNLDRERESFN